MLGLPQPSQLGLICSPHRGHWATSGDILGCHDWVVAGAARGIQWAAASGAAE